MSACKQKSMTLLAGPARARFSAIQGQLITEIDGDDFDHFEADEAEMDHDMPEGKKLPGTKHPFEWKDCGTGPTRDARADGQGAVDFKAKLRRSGTELRSAPRAVDVYYDLTAMGFLEETVTYINGKGSQKYQGGWGYLTKGEYLRWMGIWFQMMAEPRDGGRRAYWKTEVPYESFSCSQYSLAGVMSERRFDAIKSVFAMPPGPADDKFRKVRRFIESWNLHMAEVYTPSYQLVEDESMLFWSGRNMPGFIYIPRKPKATGLEMKSIACAESQVLLRVDMQEGATAMGEKQYVSEWGKSAACQLRLTQPWHGTKRIIIGDSWFGCMNAVAAFCAHGLHFILNFKGNYKPLKLIKAKISSDNPRHSFETELILTNNDKHKVYLSGHLEKKPMVVAHNCETCTDGAPRRFTVHFWEGDEEKTETFSFGTTRVHGKYRKLFNVIDLCNRVRQEHMHMAAVWKTHEWSERVIGEMWGVTAANTLAVLKHEYGFKGTPHEFKCSLAIQLLNNDFLRGENLEIARPLRRICEQSRTTLPRDTHPPAANFPTPHAAIVPRIPPISARPAHRTYHPREGPSGLACA